MELLRNLLISTPPIVDVLTACVSKSDYCVYYPFLVAAEA